MIFLIITVVVTTNMNLPPPGRLYFLVESADSSSQGRATWGAVAMWQWMQEQENQSLDGGHNTEAASLRPATPDVPPPPGVTWV